MEFHMLKQNEVGETWMRKRDQFQLIAVSYAQESEWFTFHSND